jgi:hypothetical protein
VVPSQSSGGSDNGFEGFRANILKGSETMGHIFQLSVLSQDDPECNIGSQLQVVVQPPVGGTLTANSFPVGVPVDLPTPPPTPTFGPTPTWFLELSDGIENASYTLEITGPTGQTPTTITVPGSSMRGWVKQNQSDPTNQIYLEQTCGIFGFAQENSPPDQTYWIYTVTAGVCDPRLHAA